MNILIINYEFPPLGGGAGNASYFIARELAVMKHQVTVLTSQYTGLSGDERMEGFRVIRIPVKREKRDACTVFEMLTFVASGLWNISRIADEVKPDRVLCFFTVPCGPIAYYLKMTREIPFLTLLRGGDVPGFKGIGSLAELMHRFLKPLTRLIWRQSERVIANSRGLAELAQRSWNGAIDFVPNGVDTDYFKPAAAKPLSNHIRLLFVGRFTEQKGLMPFFKELGDLALPKPWTLTLVGDGPLRRELESFANQHPVLKERVLFKGWMDKFELLVEYQNSDIFVLPSLDEGMPNVMLEAMACGLPVVASFVAGNVELIEDAVNGFLYALSDTDRLKKCLQSLAADSALVTQLGSQARKTAEKFDWKQTAARMIEAQPA